MASKYSSAVFVTFWLMFSLANANPITSILQLPAQLGNFISENLMILTKLPIISTIVGSPNTTPAPTSTIIPIGGAEVTATAGVATGTSPSAATQTPLAEATIAPVNQPPASSSQATTIAGVATAGVATGTSPNTAAAPVNQSPSSSAAPPPAEGMSEAPIVGDASATASSTAVTESPAENTS